ncbi:MAG: DEAD/DEAH box helicase [Deltaproteobacteria bacterium]|nr:DEAD/DEAH box helicase [Deltaproteobacteria bacterium]MCB9787002.1 DEAD/DEAH box helicase [Deltaproteobacteria bacterium]
MTLYREGRETGLLLWAPDDAHFPPGLRAAFLRGRWQSNISVFVPDGERRLVREPVSGWYLDAARAASALAPLSLTAVDRMAPSIAVWALASKWVVEAIAREQVVPALLATEDPEVWSARWRAAPVRPDDRARLTGLAAAMPGVARAWPVSEDRVLTADAALLEFIDAATDGLLRAQTLETAPHPGPGPSWAVRVGRALAGPQNRFAIQGLSDRHVPDALARWIAPATAVGGGRPLVGFRLEEPGGRDSTWRITYHLLDAGGQARVSVADLRDGRPSAVEAASRMSSPADTLLDALGRCARVFPPIERSLQHELPAIVHVDAAEAWSFLTRAAISLQRAGYWVDVPAALSRVGRRRLRARMRLGTETVAEAGRGGGLLSGLVAFRWEASLGDDALTPSEFKRLAEAKSALVLHRGQWVAVDPEEVERLRHLMDGGGGELPAAEALRLALASEVSVPGAGDTLADVVCDGAVARALEVLSSGVEGRLSEIQCPDGLHGDLRPYQKRGLDWMLGVTNIGFGACLADDMGLGKTVELLALFQSLCESRRGNRFLVVCPTSVLGNWRREVQRFVPGIATLVHHGAGRAGDARALQAAMRARMSGADGIIVITSYALARRDVEFFASIEFDALALDEAQNIKNPEAAQSRAVRQLVARRRLALTGTPVENRLTELWSIMDFLNPGLLGSRTSFKKSFAVPVERYGDADAAEKLRRVTAPFILRRLKTDPAIAPDLPDKVETVRFCPLTREQAALYQAALDEAMSEIAGLAPGMERRGRILAMLTALKQICNHPAHYLRDDDNAPRRSGKLTRFLELLDEVVETGGHPLVFTQYREMGEILERVLTRRLGTRVPFYHGGLPRVARDRIVASFQDPHGPPVLIVSLKAGGTGLNLTRANHVFHYDRWWNPAVEDQATDRAFRIGQTRDVTVHRLVSQGTLEEQIHQILEDKRSLADRVVGAGETWLSELDDATLHDLVSLGQDAVAEEDP